jgi:TusA-related sulfurtransferase
MHRPDRTLDIQGLAGRRMRSLAVQALGPMRPGEVLKLITTDRGAQEVIAALCREEGFVLLDSLLEDAHYSFFIQR